MKASENSMLKLLQSVRQFCIPVFQRPYSWRVSHCRQLWQDIERVGSLDEGVHFVGSVVYVTDISTVAEPAPNMIIDGQQRLTTVMLLLEALARHLPHDYSHPLFTPAKIRYYFLRHDPESGDARYRLLLSKTDKESFCALMDEAPLPSTVSERIRDNFEFFEESLKACKDVSAIIRGLNRLFVVEIALNGREDNPQRIFESLNSTGLDLSQADLIRNFLLMGLPSQQQQTLYQNYWWPMEALFGQKDYQERFDFFMRDYLTLRHSAGSIPALRNIYTTFKDMMAQTDADSAVKDIHRAATQYAKLALGQESDVELRKVFDNVAELVGVAYPFLLAVEADYEGGRIQKQDVLEIARMVENYVFRRAICDIPTNSLNKTFATFMNEASFDKARYVESVKAIFLLLTAQRRFPSDAEFQEAFTTRNIYKGRITLYCLTKLELYLGNKEQANLTRCTVEHIMPQTPSDEWKRDLGQDWERIHETWLHTVGNLTLTGYNSTYSNEPFATKRDMCNGFRKSMLHLNRALHDVTQWDEAAIQTRAASLAKSALQIWPLPALEKEKIQEYRRQRRVGIYTLQDHLHICGGPMSTLFEQLRQQILALGSEVYEEVLKLYIAYKADTNFVDIVPQKSKLRLSLNMPFDQLDDPRGMAINVTQLGRWGNGNAEICLTNTEDIPYVMKFIRQSLALQVEE